MGRRRQRSRRKTGTSLNLVLEKKENKLSEKDNINLDEDELREIAKYELGSKWKYLDTENYNTEYNIRYVNDLDEAFIPSVEYLDNVSEFLKTDYYYEQFIENPQYENLSYQDYKELLSEAEFDNGSEITKDFLQLFVDNDFPYHLVHNDEYDTYYLEADNYAINANPIGSQSVEEYPYKIYFTNKGSMPDNLFQDGDLVVPEEIIAVFYESEDRFLTAKELANIKFSDKGIQPKIYQLEGKK